MKRILYRSDKNFLYNKDLIHNNHESISVTINRNTFEITIKGEKTGLLYEAKGKSKVHAKSLVKAKLRALNVYLDIEVRKEIIG